ncbi:MHS family proline/betaine transporter-like MFS transporter [Arthrobacter globiformis]|uniref:MFS transporter n=1 Tax=Arthrobacter globiformis TaxID=1665 RepID=UPI00277D9D5C|nr:MFS transporter [Arthrobacter globiformis]MDQ1060263.1 MHS family proline/betaine transporter-like MFS transporter [Arthrobacter globiformis]
MNSTSLTGSASQPPTAGSAGTSPATSQSKKAAIRGIVAATVGNALEWFDMGIYALLAIYIGKNFFPAANPAVELIQAFAVFGVSYLIRPIGGLILGSYADRKGLKKSLMLTIRLMVLGTALIAFMPGYDQIGLLAPLGIILARLIQGFSAGGEFGAATSFLIAQDSKRKSFLGSFQFASQGLGALMAAVFVAILTALLSDADMTAWGWRIPFVFGLLVGPAGYLIRKQVDEAPIVRTAETVKDSPIVDVFKTQKLGMLIAAGALAISTAINFILQYMPTYGIKQLGLHPSASFSCLVITGVILTFGTPLVGHLADKYGRLKIMVPSVIITGLMVIPLFLWLIAGKSLLVLAATMTILGCLKAAYFGALPSLMSDAFDARSRTTGLSFSYNASVAAFGGFTPMVATYLIETTGQAIAPGYYLAVLACLSLAALGAGLKWQGIR